MVFAFFLLRKSLLELEKLREEIEKISRILNYPANFENVADKTTMVEKPAIFCSMNIKKYDAYVALVCAMLKCNEQLMKRSIRDSDANFMRCWFVIRPK
jgi:hypothetical protein